MIHKILCFLGLHSFVHTMELKRIKVHDIETLDKFDGYSVNESTVYVPVSRCIFCNKEV